jgi:hypothetical protein
MGDVYVAQSSPYTASIVTGSPTPPVSCAYPLNASEAELLALGLAGKLVMSGSEQIGTYTYQSGLGTLSYYGAAPTDVIPGPPATLDFSTGAHAAQVNLDIDAPLIAGNIFVVPNFLSTDFQEGFGAQITATPGGFTTDIITKTGGADTTVYTSGSVGTYPAALTFRVSAGVLRVWADNSELVLSDTAVASAEYFFFAQVGEDAGANAANAGLTASIGLASIAADITAATLPGGTTDPCGAAIGA